MNSNENNASVFNYLYLFVLSKKWEQNSLHFVILTIWVKPFIIGHISDANNTSFNHFYIYFLKMSSISFDLSVWPKFSSLFHFFKQFDSSQLLLLFIKKIHWALDFILFSFCAFWQLFLLVLYIVLRPDRLFLLSFLFKKIEWCIFIRRDSTWWIHLWIYFYFVYHLYLFITARIVWVSVCF